MISRTPKQLVSDFSPSNTHVHVNHTQVAWQPLEVPTEKLDFIHGLRTVAGNGTAVSKEGMAFHFYVANESAEYVIREYPSQLTRSEQHLIRSLIVLAKSGSMSKIRFPQVRVLL